MNELYAGRATAQIASAISGFPRLRRASAELMLGFAQDDTDERTVLTSAAEAAKLNEVINTKLKASFHLFNYDQR